MTVTTTQKVIKIGDSNGVTIPAKMLKQTGIKAGDEIQISFKAIPQVKPNVMDEYAIFAAQYGETLKNLSQR